MGCTCGEPDEIKKTTHPKNITDLFGGQAIYCNNRKSALFAVEVARPAHVHTVWEDAGFNASSPTFSPGGVLVWQSSEFGGPHQTASRVLCAAWDGTCKLGADPAVVVGLSDEQAPGVIAPRFGQETQPGIFVGWVSFLILLGSPHARPMRARNSGGEPNEIELTIRVLKGCFAARFQARAGSRRRSW